MSQAGWRLLLTIAFLAGGRIVAEGTPIQLRANVARTRGEPIERVSMETVFMELTGRSIDEDEEQDDNVPVPVAAGM